MNEHFAHLVVQIMLDAGTSSGEIMVRGAIDAEWLKRGGDTDDLRRGLEYAHNQHWIENAGVGAISLTAEGAAALGR
jgi:hypothetical protein